MIASPRNNWMIDGVQPVDWLCPLNRGLVAWWLGIPGWTGGRRFIDLTSPGPNGHHGTLTNMDPATDWVPAPWGGQALKFDGVDQYANAGTIDVSTWTSATFSAWVKDPNEQGMFVTILHSGNDDFRLLTEGGSIKMVWDDGTFSPAETSDSLITDGEWHHLVGLHRNGTTELYVDGQLRIFTSETVDFAGADGRTMIGASARTPLGQFSTAAFIDDVRIYNRGLLASEVKALYLDSLQGYPQTLRRMRRTIFAAADVAPPTGNPWYYYANQAAVIG